MNKNETISRGKNTFYATTTKRDFLGVKGKSVISFKVVAFCVSKTKKICSIVQKQIKIARDCSVPCHILKTAAADGRCFTESDYQSFFIEKNLERRERMIICDYLATK